MDISIGNIFWNNNFTDNQVQAFESASSYNNSWNFSNNGNYWGDFKNNSGYPYSYIIDGPGEGIDYWPMGKCIDADGDSFSQYPNPNCPYDLDLDCDDTNPNIYPGAAELCNNVDDDCDGQIDEGCVQLNMSLNKGWNLISIPVVLENNSVASVFAGINYSRIFGYDLGWFVPTEINSTLGYWIKVNNSANLTLEGVELGNTTINLDQGWKLIGYPSLVEQNISINGTVFGYENGLWHKDPTFKPGYGYWVKVDEDTTLVLS